ncbi:hypothetical protein Tco_0167734 [Tanacetum coccineum]
MRVECPVFTYFLLEQGYLCPAAKNSFLPTESGSLGCSYRLRTLRARRCPPILSHNDHWSYPFRLSLPEVFDPISKASGLSFLPLFPLLGVPLDLTDSMNYQPVRSENQANKHAGPQEANHNTGTKDNIDAGYSEKEDESAQDYFVLSIWSSYSSTVKRSTEKDAEKDANDAAEALRKEFAYETEDLLLQAGAAKASSTNTVNTISTPVSTVSPYDRLSFSDPTNPDQDDSEIPTLEDIYKNPTDGIFTNSSYDDEGAVADFTNLEPVVNVTPSNLKKDDKEDQVFLDELERLKRQEKDANDAAEALRKEFAQEIEDLLLQAGAAKPSSTNIINTPSTPVSTDSPYDGLSFSDLTNPNQDDSEIPALEDIYKNPTDGIFTNSSYDDEGVVADFTNLEPVVNVSPIPTSRINSIHPSTLILGDPQSAVQTRSKVTKSSGAHAFVSYIQKQRRNNHKDFQHCLFACFLSQNEPKKISKVLEDESWVDAMQEELLHLDAKKKFVMYPRFISIFLDKQLVNVPVPLDHFPVNALTSKVFSFMVKKGKHFSGKVTPLFASMLVQSTEDEGATSERPSEPQPIYISSSPSETILALCLTSPRHSPSSSFFVSITVVSGGFLGGQSHSQKTQEATNCYDIPRAWMKSVSLKQRLAGKKSLKSNWMQKESDAQDVGRTRNGVNAEKEDTEDAVSTEDVVSTDKEKDKDSTVSLDEGTDDRTEARSVTPITSTTTPTMFGDDETIAQVLLNMSQAKAVSREKEKGVELKDVEETERPMLTSTRSLLTLKPLPKIDPKDKGKKKIEEEDESDTESEDIPKAEKKFKKTWLGMRDGLVCCKRIGIRRRRKRLVVEVAYKGCPFDEYDFIHLQELS